MKVVCYNNIQDLPPGYDELFNRQNSLAFDQTKVWYQTYIEEILDPNIIPLLYGIEHNNKNTTPLGFLPMCYKQRTPLSFLIPRQLCSLSNYYTSVFCPILDETHQSTRNILHNLIAHLANQLPAWHIINIEPLDKKAAIFSELCDAISSNGMIKIPYFRFGNWYLELAGRNFNEYYDQLPAALKNTLSRKSKKLLNNNKIQIEIFFDISQLDTAFEHYEYIYSRSWKIAEPYPNFIRRIAYEYAQIGWLRLGILYVNKEPAAAQIWFVKNKVASIFKLAYDPKFSEYSVGSVLTMQLMEHVIHIDGVDRVDYLIGDDAYKKDWMSHRRERWGIMAFNAKTPKGMLAAARHISTRKIKEFIR